MGWTVQCIMCMHGARWPYMWPPDFWSQNKWGPKVKWVSSVMPRILGVQLRGATSSPIRTALAGWAGTARTGGSGGPGGIRGEQGRTGFLESNGQLFDLFPICTHHQVKTKLVSPCLSLHNAEHRPAMWSRQQYDGTGLHVQFSDSLVV